MYYTWRSALWVVGGNIKTTKLDCSGYKLLAVTLFASTYYYCTTYSEWHWERHEGRSFVWGPFVPIGRGSSLERGWRRTLLCRHQERSSVALWSAKWRELLLCRCKSSKILSSTNQIDRRGRRGPHTIQFFFTFRLTLFDIDFMLASPVIYMVICPWGYGLDFYIKARNLRLQCFILL